MIHPPIDKIRIIQRQLRRSIDDIIRCLHPQHEAVILVTDLVSPASETPAGVDVVFILEGGEELFKDAFALEGRGGVAVIEAAVVGRDDFVVGLEHRGVEEAGDAVFED